MGGITSAGGRSGRVRGNMGPSLKKLCCETRPRHPHSHPHPRIPKRLPKSPPPVFSVAHFATADPLRCVGSFFSCGSGLSSPWSKARFVGTGFAGLASSLAGSSASGNLSPSMGSSCLEAGATAKPNRPPGTPPPPTGPPALPTPPYKPRQPAAPGPTTTPPPPFFGRSGWGSGDVRAGVGPGCRKGLGRVHSAGWGCCQHVRDSLARAVHVIDLHVIQDLSELLSSKWLAKPRTRARLLLGFPTSREQRARTRGSRQT